MKFKFKTVRGEMLEVKATRIGGDLFVHRCQYIEKGKIVSEYDDWVVSHTCGLMLGKHYRTRKEAIMFAETFNSVRTPDAVVTPMGDSFAPSHAFLEAYKKACI
jgi:hypothetical protein